MTEELIGQIAAHVDKHGPLDVVRTMRILFEDSPEEGAAQIPEMDFIWKNTVRPGFIKLMRETEEECERLYRIGQPDNS